MELKIKWKTDAAGRLATVRGGMYQGTVQILDDDAVIMEVTGFRADRTGITILSPMYQAAGGKYFPISALSPWMQQQMLDDLRKHLSAPDNREDAKTWLMNYLREKGGRAAATTVYAVASERGYDVRTIRQAKRDAGVAGVLGRGSWDWFLP